MTCLPLRSAFGVDTRRSILARASSEKPRGYCGPLGATVLGAMMVAPLVGRVSSIVISMEWLHQDALVGHVVASGD